MSKTRKLANFFPPTKSTIMTGLSFRSVVDWHVWMYRLWRVHLLMTLYKIVKTSAGSIMIDGIGIVKIGLADFRNHMALRFKIQVIIYISMYVLMHAVQNNMLLTSCQPGPRPRLYLGPRLYLSLWFLYLLPRGRIRDKGFNLLGCQSRTAQQPVVYWVGKMTVTRLITAMQNCAEHIHHTCWYVYWSDVRIIRQHFCQHSALSSHISCAHRILGILAKTCINNSALSKYTILFSHLVQGLNVKLSSA